MCENMGNCSGKMKAIINSQYFNPAVAEIGVCNIQLERVKHNHGGGKSFITIINQYILNIV